MYLPRKFHENLLRTLCAMLLTDKQTNNAIENITFLTDVSSEWCGFVSVVNDMPIEQEHCSLAVN